jgi:asparagine synthase (glutamine-hydrolysing)
MCGICGFAGAPGSDDPARVARDMTTTLRHRGPDGEDILLLPQAREDDAGTGYFGHTRLKVLDLGHRAHQPMTSEDSRVVLTFNGEIYNFPSLRRELVARGHTFRSTGDTEVVLHAYLEWGEESIVRLDGMFAFALWDARDATLLLVRDRVGKKPLYYHEADGRVTFGSEIKALLAAPWVPPSPDLQRLPEYLTFGYVSQPRTFYEGIRQVPPGGLVRFRAGRIEGPVEYWNPAPQTAPSRRANTQVIAELVRNAVARRMRADVPFGALLSGGLDSSIVVGLMSGLSDGPIRTFSVGFPDDLTYDERPFARLVATRFRTDHYEFAVKADSAALMDRLLWHHDQPFGDSSAVPTYLVSELARSHVTVVLTGDGGDEAFAGYDRFAAVALAERVPPPLAHLAKACVRLLPRRSGYRTLRSSAERFFASPGAPVLDQYVNWVSVFDRAALQEIAVGTAVDSWASVRNAYTQAGPGTRLDRIVNANLRTYLPDDLAVKMDRMSMAHSLEARSPFLDTTLLEYMSGVPASAKVGIFRPKPLLRSSFDWLLPREILRRKKHGFGVPMGHWFRTALAPVLEDELLARDARAGPLLDRRTLLRWWSQHRTGERDYGPRFWTLLTLERWLRGLERPPRARAPELPISAALTRGG